MDAGRALPASLARHRIRHRDVTEVTAKAACRSRGPRDLWFFGMAAAAIVGGALTFSPARSRCIVATTATVLLFGHSLGSHRKLIHDSFQCPRWLEYTLVYLGVQVGLAGPLGLLGNTSCATTRSGCPSATTIYATAVSSGATRGGSSSAS